MLTGLIENSKAHPASLLSKSSLIQEIITRRRWWWGSSREIVHTWKLNHISSSQFDKTLKTVQGWISPLNVPDYRLKKLLILRRKKLLSCQWKESVTTHLPLWGETWDMAAEWWWIMKGRQNVPPALDSQWHPPTSMDPTARWRKTPGP